MHQNSIYYPVQPNYSQGSSLPFQNVNAYQPQCNNIAPWQNVAENGPNIYNRINTCVPVVYPPTSHINTPVSTAMYGTTATFSWAHTIPSPMPWVTKCDPNIPDPVMRFSAPIPPDAPQASWEMMNNTGTSHSSASVNVKRKGELEDLESMPHKQCITEERMAARLRELHISNHYSIPSESTPFSARGGEETDGASDKSITSLQQLETMLKDSEFGNEASKSLILSPEIKKLVEPEKLFAKTFLNEIERPSMAIVLWHPQEEIIKGSHVEKEKTENVSGASSSQENNNNSIESLSAMLYPPSSSPSHTTDVMDT